MNKLNYIYTSESNAYRSADAGFVTKIESIILQQTPDPAFGVPELAAQLQLSKAELSRKLLFQTGFSPGKLIQQFRIEQARELLLQNIKSVKEISWQCGYSNTNTFCRKFKKETGMRPLEFREKYSKIKNNSLFEWEIPINESCMQRIFEEGRRKNWFKKLLLNIINNLHNESFNTAELAAAICLSQSQLNRKLHQLLSISTGRLVRDLRLQLAIELLAENKQSVTEVACRAGFFDAAHLTRCLRQVAGCAPGEYRKNGYVNKCLDSIVKNFEIQTDY